MKRKLHGTVLLFLFFVLPFATKAAITITEAHSNVNCNGASTATIDITATGGTGVYTYQWSDGAGTEDRTGLAAGNYWVTVSDNGGQSNVLLVFISEPPAMTILKSITNVYCGGASTGAIDVTVLGGSPGYTYQWSDGATTEDRVNIPASNYYFTVTDIKGCTKDDSANVTQPPGMVLTKTVTNVTCGSGANGAIDLTVQFGVPGYFYLWNDGAVTQDRTAIAAGTYTVTVTDISGCTATTSATVNQTGAGMAVNTTSTNVWCNGGSNGSITVTSVIGSVGPYTFRWSDGPTTQNRAGISAGSYTVTATSTTGCTAAATVNITQPAALTVTLTPIQLTCYGSNNGAINTSVSGGTAPYSYSWAGGGFTQNRTLLASGNYTVTVTDNRGCTATQTTFVPQPLQLTLNAVPSAQACAGGPTGSVVTTVTGGVGSYSYNWGGGVTSANQNNVNSGNYSVTVTDGNGCSSSASATVQAYTPMVLSSTQINNTCAGASAGSINLTVANGWSPFTYTWSNSAVTEDISSLAAGTYTVTVNDNHSCTATRSVTITQPASITVASTVTDVNCSGGNNGAISVTVSNGVSPYTYNWGSGIITQNRTGLTAGTYVLIVTDNNSCSTSVSIAVAQPLPVSIAAASTDASCNGGTNGTVSLTPSGGTSPYTYSWAGGSTSQNRSGLAQGTYNVTVTDINSCTGSASVIINQPAAISITPTVTNVTCNGGANGAISISTTGGTTPYSYNWGGVTTQNRTGLTAGTYVLTLTDNAGCTATSSSVVNQPSAIGITSVNTNVSCNAGNNGTINLSVSGGTPSYTFNWGSAVTSQNRISLTAGSYTVTVTDLASCTATFTTTITQPAALSVSATVTNVSCNGGNNGAINIAVAGGTSPYGFNWGGSVTTQNRTGLNPGTYNVTVTDNAGCSSINSSTVNQPAALVVASTITNVTCFGASTGAININASGGNSPYSFNWGTGIISQNRSGLVAGTYVVTVTDNTGCTATKSSTITSAPAITLSAAVTNVTCNGGNDGVLNVSVSGGTSPFTFSWGDGPTSQNRSGLTAGNYVLTVTDNSACTASNTFVVSQPSTISVSSATTNVACNGGSTGTITLTVSGGMSPYSFDWGTGVTTQNRTGLVAGPYTVTVTDNNGCSATHTATIGQTTSLGVSATQVNVTCPGGNNGSITTTVTGGTSPYTYNWGGAVITPNRTAITAGTYNLTVTDNAGCTASNSTTITEPSAIVANATITAVACAGGNTGAINLSVTGGTSPYSFNWGSSVTTQNRTALAQGNYTVTITDNLACTQSNTFTVGQNASLNITSVITPVSCNGGSNGTISITATGGTIPYAYNWGGGINTQNRSGLPQGNYVVTVTDNAGCSGSLASTVSQPAALAAGAVVTNISCNGANNGAITLNPTGGTSPYSFDWGGGVVSQNRTGLSVGSYTVILTDNNACTATSTSVISEPAVLSLSTTATDVACYGASTGNIALTVTGGTTAYSYSWSNGPVSQNNPNIPAGNYSVIVTDANACTASASASLNQGNQIATSISLVNTTCYNFSNGSIDLSASGGAGAFTYNWSNGATTEDLSSIPANTYTVTVTDGASCTTLATATVAGPTIVILTNAVADELCNGDGSGAIDLTVSGGTGVYSYMWSNGATVEDITNLAAQTYTITVSDNNGCSATRTIPINQPAPLVIGETHTNVSCNAGSNGTINLSPAGGVGPYFYDWGNSITSQNRTGLAAASYTATVTDVNACSATITIAISQPNALAITSVKTDVTCAGSATGGIDITTTGGTTNYTYRWNNNAVTQDLSGVIAGAYTVTVTDANLCTATSSSTITQPAPITVSFSVTNVTCNGGTDGAISTTATGGTGSYNFAWSNSGSTASISNLTSGTYTLSLTDATNCATVLSFNVAQPAAMQLSETHVAVTCNGGNNGSIDLTANGGASPYTYLWSNNAVSQDVSGLQANVYSVVVTDDDGCTATLGPVNIAQGVPLALSTIATDVSCNGGNTGAVDLTVTGGAGGYTYHWNNNAATQDISGVTGGNYQVTVTDASTCTATTSALISQAGAVVINLNKTDATCYGSANGAVASTVTGGNGSYTYHWNNNSSATSLSALSAATYTLTVNDTQGCSAVATATVAQPAQIVVSESHIDISCFGNNDGAINAAVTGGVGNLTYNWSNSASTLAINSLPPAVYTLTVTDASSCSATKAVTIVEPSAIALNETHKPFACATNAGAIDLSVTGGTTPYQYSWTGGATTQDVQNLQPGPYLVNITDAHGCISSMSVNIAQLTQLSTTVSATNLNCNGAANGAINLQVQGGTAPYTYHWTNGGTTATVSGLAAGNYRAVVIDSNNCSIIDSAVVTEPTAIVILDTVHNVTCNGLHNGSISIGVSGGVPAYSYHWNTGAATQNIYNLTRGSYSLTVMDANTCSVTRSNIMVYEPQVVSVTSTIIPVACVGHTDGEIQIQVSGGVQPFTYNWNNGATTQSLNGIAAGNYNLTVTDINGCTGNGGFTVTTVPPMVITPAIHHTSCVGVENGSISLGVSGGTQAMTFGWNTGDHASILSNLGEGDYSVTVTDARNCSVEGSYSIAADYALTVDASGPATINLGETAELTAVSNVDHNNAYLWTPSRWVICSNCQNTTAYPTSATLFTVNVVDANGCKASDTLTVDVNTITNVFVPNAFTPNNDGNNDVLQLFGDLSAISYLDFAVFNRWGEKVFESSNHQFTWDGVYKGEIVPQGVYVYSGKIVFSSGYSRDLKGSVTVIR